MATAQLNLRLTPRRMLTATEAADYVGMPARRLKVDCPVSPVELPGGTLRYDMRDLDTWLDGLKGGSLGDDAILDLLG